MKMQGLQFQVLFIFLLGFTFAEIDVITPELPLRVKYFSEMFSAKQRIFSQPENDALKKRGGMFQR